MGAGLITQTIRILYNFVHYSDAMGIGIYALGVRQQKNVELI